MQTSSTPAAEITWNGDGTKVLVLYLPLETPGANKFMAHTGWMLKRKLRKMALKMMGDALLQKFGTTRVEHVLTELGWPLKGKRLVYFEMSRGVLLDEGDNDRIVLKPVRDALVETGLLVDDNQKWGVFHYWPQKKQPKRELRGVRISVRNIP